MSKQPNVFGGIFGFVLTHKVKQKNGNESQINISLLTDRI
ncbi:MAG: hypothetical protein UZ11_BCD004001917 [Bacteroidetes bacterium OLB11]|nr:MAG: hypothetical protein UZ11_BCD004001917 [Bacteroidetes bacterium OLB11]